MVRFDECYESMRIIWQVLAKLDQCEGAPTMVADPEIAWPARLAVGTDGQGNSAEHVREIMGESMESLIHHFKLVTEGFHVPAARSTRPSSTRRASWAFTSSPTVARARSARTSATPPTPTCKRWP